MSMDIFLDKVCDELEDIEKKLKQGAKLSPGDWKMISDLIDTKKNILKTEKLEDELDDGYSGRDGMQNGDYRDGGSSYANRGRHYVRPHYSRASRRDDRGRYSGADGRSKMMEHLEMALDSANEQDREDIRRFMRRLENA